MSESIATVTATVEGEQVEDNNEIARGGLSSLLGSIFDDEDVSVVIHEVHDEEQVEDLKARYSDRWEARVESESEGEGEDRDDSGLNPIIGLTAVECPDCEHAQVADKTAGKYQCAECLTRFGSIEATFHAAGDDPREAGATVHEAY